VLDHLAERDRPAIKHRLRRAWAEDDHDHALSQTITITRLGIKGRLKRTLQSTNPCESMIETVRRTSRNVKRWQSGEMCLRWTAAGMLEAERQFRRIVGHADLARLPNAVERQLHQHTTTPEIAASLT
jgi:hypothetical protein